LRLNEKGSIIHVVPDRRISSLAPDFQPYVLELVKRLKDAFKDDGLAPFITDGKRTLSEQKRLYGKGRSAGQLIKAGYDKDEAMKYANSTAKVVTWTLDSFHLKGLAIDVAWLDKKTGKLTYNANWSKMGEIVKEMNLTWGGLWKTPDKPHVQLDQVPMETQPNKEALWESDARKWAQENKVIENWNDPRKPMNRYEIAATLMKFKTRFNP